MSKKLKIITALMITCLLVYLQQQHANTVPTISAWEDLPLRMLLND